MVPEPTNWEALGGKNIWPDRLLYNVNPDGKIELLFVIDKGNSRSLSAGRDQLVRVLQAAGLRVMLSFSGQLFTLDEFNSGVAYQNRAGIGRQQVYNAKAELRQLEFYLQQTDPISPNYQSLMNRIEAKKRLLSAVELQNAPPPNNYDPDQNPFQPVGDELWGKKLLRVMNELKAKFPPEEAQERTFAFQKFYASKSNMKEAEAKVLDPSWSAEKEALDLLKKMEENDEKGGSGTPQSDGGGR